MDDKILYNKESAEKYGWHPEWFGAIHNDEQCVNKIMDFQRRFLLTADGMCGPTTFRYLMTERESHIDELTEDVEHNEYIVWNDTRVPIDWPKVVLWGERGGMAAKNGSYRKSSGERDITMFVNHWDVCLSSRRCHKVLENRSISVHFMIDNDGTIWQTMDINDVAYHAGSRLWNNCSVGVEVSCAFDQKYQDWYVRNGFGKRPIWESVVHGETVGPHLGFYDIQIKALKALWKAIVSCTNVEWNTPVDDEGKMFPTRHPEASKGEFCGIVQHFQLKRSKVDVAGLDLPTLIEEAKNE